MGGAASAHAELDQMVACTFLLGQALSRAFPEIYTLNDFHANSEKLKRQMQREHEKRLKEMQSTVPMVFLGPDGTVTPVKFVGKTGEQAGGEGSGQQLEDKKDASASNDDEGEEDNEDDEDDEDDDAIGECLVVSYQDRNVPIRLETIGEPNECGWTVLHAASHQKATVDAAEAIIRVFQERGIDLDTKTKRGPGSYATGWTALHIACAYGIEPTVAALIAAGAEVTTTNSVGWMPLHEAVHRGYTGITARLLKAGALCDDLIPASMIAPYHPQRPLAHACRQGHEEVVKTLLEAGADVNAQNDGGWGALHESVFFRNQSCVALLLENGADVGLKTAQGYSVLDFETVPSIRKLLEDAAPPELLEKRKGGSAGPGEGEGKSSAEARAAIRAEELAEGKDATEPSGSKPEYRLLGDLPDFKANSFMQTVSTAGLVSQDDDGSDDEATRGERQKRIARRQSLRKKRGDVKLKGVAEPDAGVPAEYACHLSGKLMVDPVTTVYGNHFERSAVVAWIRSQGNLCPVSGQPLSESDCIVDKDLRIEISDWQLKQALSNSSGPAAAAEASTTTAAAPGAAGEEDDLYDF